MKLVTFAGAACVAVSAGLSAAQPVVIYSRAPNSPTSTVPGALDINGLPTTVKFLSMLDFWLSPDGSKFLLRGSTDPVNTVDSYLLLGSGTTGSLILQESRPFPGAVGAEVVDFIGTLNTYPFNANNEWAMTVRARGGVASVFNKLIRYNTASVGTLRFQMGDPYVGLIDSPVGSSGDETLGNSEASLHLLNDGRMGWQDNSVGNLSSTRRPITCYDAVKFLQSRVDTVTKIDNSGPILLTNIASTGTISVFWTSPDGTLTVIRGTPDQDGNGTNIPADPDAVIVNGVVRIQVNIAIPGDTLVPTTIGQTSVTASNDWYARGNTATGAWATRNGAVIAKTGDSIGADTWGTSFYAIAGSTNGDYAIAGKSGNANPAIDDVVVVNGRVVLREGDAVPIDLDGNGTMETAFIGRGNNTLAAFVANNDLGLAPNRTLYVLAFLRDGAGVDLAPSGTPYALIRIVPPCPADYDGNGAIEPADVAAFVNVWFASLTGGTLEGDFDGNGLVEPADVAAFVNAWFTALVSGC